MVCLRSESSRKWIVKNLKMFMIIFTKDENNEDQILLKEKCALNFRPLNINPKEDIAVIQYTGGTTGKSKGVMLTHFNIICNIHQSSEVFSSVIKKGEERILGVCTSYPCYGDDEYEFCNKIGSNIILF